MRHQILLTFLLVSMVSVFAFAQSELPEVILVSPADGGTISTHELSFVWSVSPAAPDISYDLHIFALAGSTFDTVVTQISDTSFTFDLVTGGNASWYVVARNQLGDSTVSDSVGFQIICCEGETGDVNADGTLNLTDLTQFVMSSCLEKTFECIPIPCRAAANTNGDQDCFITLTDLTLLINRLFINYQPNAQCDEFDQSLCR